MLIKKTFSAILAIAFTSLVYCIISMVLGKINYENEIKNSFQKSGIPRPTDFSESFLFSVLTVSFSFLVYLILWRSTKFFIDKELKLIHLLFLLGISHFIVVMLISHSTVTFSEFFSSQILFRTLFFSIVCSGFIIMQKIIIKLLQSR